MLRVRSSYFHLIFYSRDHRVTKEQYLMRTSTNKEKKSQLENNHINAMLRIALESYALVSFFIYHRAVNTADFR